MRNDVVEELFKKYYNGALLYALSLTANKHLAEEIVSTAFYKALRSADDDVRNFKPWLIKVCRNLWFDTLRKRKRYADFPEEIVDESEHAVEKIIRDEQYQALYKAIELLPESQRETVLLFYFENLKIKDIATVTEKTEDNVKVLLYRARENLKKILEKEV